MLNITPHSRKYRTYVENRPDYALQLNTTDPMVEIYS